MSETKKCQFCAEEIKREATFCKYCKTNLIPNNLEKTSNDSRKIIENKATCLVCGETWHFNKWDERTNLSNTMHNSVSALFPFMPQRKTVDLNKCPKCGSRAVKTEKATYYKNNNTVNTNKKIKYYLLFLIF
jgi:hypothetical protein